MRATEVTSRLAQFLERLHPHLDAHTDAVMVESIQGWIRAYHYLHVLRGGYSPQAMAYMQEHFATFATSLLDHMADTFCHYFVLPWPCAEVPHTRLARVFPALCAAHQLQGDIAGLHAYMHELQDRIVAQDKAVLASHAAWQNEPGGTPLPAPLMELLSCIDQYSLALLRFFEQNTARSLLCRQPPPHQS